MTKMNRLSRRMEKLRQLENGRKQFCALARPQIRTYVWVNSISLPVAVTR